MEEPRRAIPSVDKILQELGEQGLPRAVVLRTVRAELQRVRMQNEPVAAEKLLAQIRERLDDSRAMRLRPVINATGVLVHTNLGRSPLCVQAADALKEIASGYTNLELDLHTGHRGARGEYVESLVALVSGAEAATVVNNCAAALVLALRHFTRARPEVIISRGELVQIGGGFRIPEILEGSGARLKEVGTTNRTTLQDYEQAISPSVGMILKVHQSNFHMEGFVASPDREELARLGKRVGMPVMEDLGSGAISDTAQIASIRREPTPADSLAAGIDLVCFSGDKLLGGPQAGLIAGRAEHITALKKEPFFRALRCDKLIFAALQATLETHLHHKGEAPALPLWQMLNTTLEELEARAAQYVRRLRDKGVQAELSKPTGEIGGGALPTVRIDSIGVDVQVPGKAADAIMKKLRKGAPPVIAYLEQGKIRFDLRTVFPSQDEALIATIATAFKA